VDKTVENHYGSGTILKLGETSINIPSSLEAIFRIPEQLHMEIRRDRSQKPYFCENDFPIIDSSLLDDSLEKEAINLLSERLPCRTQESIASAVKGAMRLYKENALLRDDLKSPELSMENGTSFIHR
jgi:hypothetical protein